MLSWMGGRRQGWCGGYRVAWMLLLLATAACRAGAVESIRFAPEKDYGPFVFQDRDGAVRGISIDFLDLIRVRTGLQIQTLAPQPLGRILEQARAGQVDLVSSLRPTPERAAYLAFTSPYVSVPAVLVTREAGVADDLGALAGRTIAVGQGYAVEAYVRRRFPAVRWLAVLDDGAGLRALMAGQVQGVVADAASVTFLSRQMGLSGLQMHGGIGFEYTLSMAYRKEAVALGRQLEQGLAAISQAERRAILARWIDEGSHPPEDTRAELIRRIGLALLAAGILLTLVVRWCRSGSR